VSEESKLWTVLLSPFRDVARVGLVEFRERHDKRTNEDPREDVGVDVDVGVVKCGLYTVNEGSYQKSHLT